MARNAKDDAVAPAAEEPDAFPLTLDEFCTRLSRTVRRPELIGAFHHTETAKGRHKDLEDAYAARFEAFSRAPA